MSPPDAQPFPYDAALSKALVSSMSTERFSTYQQAVGGSDERALQLYTWNAAVAASFYGPLQTLEVTLRNAVHDAMSLRHGDRWFEEGSALRATERRMVDEVTERLVALRKPLTTGRLVAELSSGFWVGLFANAYDATLWRTDLFRIFTPRIKNRHGLHETLDRLRTLRNRIAHHEPIFQRKLRDDQTRIRQVVGYLSPPTLRWLDHHSTVPNRPRAAT